MREKDSRHINRPVKVPNTIFYIKSGRVVPNGAPSGLSTLAISASRIDLSWTNGSSNEDGITIERSADGISFSQIATVAKGVTSYSNTGLSEASRYYYRVAAYKGAVLSSYSLITIGVTFATVFSDSNHVAVLDKSRSVTKDSSNRVSDWADIMGSGRSVAQAGADNLKPIWDAEGITADGIRQYMQSAAWTWNQPMVIYAVMKAISWTANDVLFDGRTDIRMYCYQSPTSQKITLGSAGFESAALDMTTNTMVIIRAIINGSSSNLRVNTTSTANFNGGSGTAGGLTLFSRGTPGQYANAKAASIVCRKSVPSAGDDTSIMNFLKYSNGLS